MCKYGSTKKERRAERKKDKNSLQGRRRNKAKQSKAKQREYYSMVEVKVTKVS